MPFDNMGMGFLPTDPRAKKGPTGGSYKAGQPKDSSAVITGDPSTGSIGFASTSARGDLFSEPYTAPAPDPEFAPRTASETTELRESRGVATTHQNMGTLAVDFRKEEQARKERGEQTVQEARDAKILDARTADEYKRTVLDPAAAEAAKFRAQAAGAKQFMGRYMANAEAGLARGKSSKDQRSNTTSGGLGLAGSKRSGLSSKSATLTSGLRQATKTPNAIGPDHSWLIPETSEGFQENVDQGDILALAATREHSQAPSTLAKSWQDQANAQSAGGRATPGQMAQAAVSMYARNIPNKP